MTLSTLATRVEGGSAEQQAVLLREAFEAIHGPKPPRVHGGSPELSAWFDAFNPFYRMLEAKAYESAALTMVPERYAIDTLKEGEPDSWYVNLRPRDWIGEWMFSGAATPALALVAAALRARATLTETTR